MTAVKLRGPAGGETCYLCSPNPDGVSAMPILEIQDLKTHIFLEEGVLKAVDGVNLTVNEGEIVGLVGESGCGKSMTALSIVRLPPREAETIAGKVLFEGEDLLALDEEELDGIRGRKISMVFQDPLTYLNPVMKIKTQVAEPLVLHKGLSKAEAEAQSVDILQAMGLGDAANVGESYPHELSGGMKQRVLMGMALGCDPSVLIADEPFTAVDVSIQDQLIELLQRLQRERQFSCLLITHDLGVAAEICDRVYVMYAGEIVETGDIYTIFDDPKHPYTQGLINSAKVARSDSEALPFIPGEVPSMIEPPRGCRFHPRCERAMDKCREHVPIRTDLGENHSVKCWLYE